MGDRWGAAFVRIGWQAFFGLGGSFAPDWVAGITGIRSTIDNSFIPKPWDGFFVGGMFLEPLVGVMDFHPAALAIPPECLNDFGVRKGHRGRRYSFQYQSLLLS